MTLAFKQEINGKPTMFIEKIWQSLLRDNVEMNINEFEVTFKKCLPLIGKMKVGEYYQKKHTIRKDTKRRWKEGMDIHMVINNRTKDRFQFAPVLKVKSIQRVFMTYAYNDLIQISVDGTELFGHDQRLIFAKNDGFDTWEDFFNWFYPIIMNDPKEQFSGILIHWTDLEY